MNQSGITVNDLLRLPVLKDAKVISGREGLNRSVQNIDIMEVPDVEGWLREGELLLTTAYSIRHDLSLLTKLVEKLSHANAAALAIKPERYLHEMPQEMIEVSNKYKLPIIQLPVGVPYIDITNAVMEQIVNKHAALLRRSEEIYKKLTTLVLENSGIQTVADNVSEMIEAPIILLDKQGKEIVSSPKNAKLENFTHGKDWDITVDKERVGKFLIEKEYLDDMDKICVEQARLVFSLELMRRKTAADTENQLRGNFIEELLAGIFLPQEEVVNKGRQLGLDPEIMWEIIVVESTNIIEDDSPFLKDISRLVESINLPNANKIYTQKQGNRLIILSAFSYQPVLTKDTNELWMEKLVPFMNKYTDFRVGFGGRSLLWEIHLSYLEARNSILIGSNLNKGKRIYFYEEIEIFKLLLDSTDHVNLDVVIERKIGKLIQYDKENDSDLVKTLFYYLSSNGSLKETAKQLYIHRNSVKYRIDRIKEIADITLDSFQEKLLYYFCIFFHNFKGS
ncbi:PucR family transcriptional regulator [Niallia sp. FSL W8-0635]|uniref:PucR family transcriptional regulator n=1 Tax=Niallia sp. FSL W8-0635 TaxID=2975337 RepID=UPI0030F4B3D1